MQRGSLILAGYLNDSTFNISLKKLTLYLKNHGIEAFSSSKTTLRYSSKVILRPLAM